MTAAADRIETIEGFVVRCAMPQPAGNALRVFSERVGLIVKVATASGIAGWGESWAYPHAASELIRRNLAAHVLGRDVTNPRAIHQAMLKAAVPDRRGQVHMAISAIDMAIWDAFGRASGMPVAKLLGGAVRDRIKTYASGPLMSEGADRYAGLTEAVEGYVRDGFQAFKLRVGIGLDRDRRAIELARSIVGEDAVLMIDLNEASTIADTVALAEASATAKLAWIEEPLPHDNLPGYRRLADRIGVPLAGGESFCGVQAFRDIVADGSLGVLQPDLAICGGFSEAMKVAGLADAFEIAVAPHVWGSAINFLASLQFAAVIAGRGRAPELPIFEYDMSFNPLRSKIFDPKPDRDGTIAIPDGPGLGVDIDLDAIADLVTEHWEARS